MFYRRLRQEEPQKMLGCTIPYRTEGRSREASPNQGLKGRWNLHMDQGQCDLQIMALFRFTAVVVIRWAW